MVPQHADVVVALLGAVDGALDRVTVVVDYEDYGLEAKADVGATFPTSVPMHDRNTRRAGRGTRLDLHFLNGHLHAALTNDQDYSAWKLELFLSDECSETGSDCVADRGPENLSDVADAGWECGVWHAESEEARSNMYNIVFA